MLKRYVKFLVSAGFAISVILGISVGAYAERSTTVIPEIVQENIGRGEITKDSNIGFVSHTESGTASYQNGYARSMLANMTNGDALVMIYDAVCGAVESYSETATVTAGGVTSEEMGLIVNAVINDNPEYFYFGVHSGGSVGYFDRITYVPNGGLNNYTITLLYSEEDSQALNTMKGKIQSSANDIIDEYITDGMTDYQKALVLHDAICEKVVYDQTQSKPWVHTVYGSLVNDLAVCDGYAKAYQYLLKQVGVESHMVTGESHSEGHAWNIVKLNNKWYYTDVTWDDQEGETFHVYLNVPESQITKDHTIDQGYDLPAANWDDLTYFKQNPQNVAVRKSTTTDEELKNKVTNLLIENPYAVIYVEDDGYDIANFLNNYGSIICVDVMDEVAINPSSMGFLSMQIKPAGATGSYYSGEYHFKLISLNTEISVDPNNKHKIYFSYYRPVGGKGKIMQALYDENDILAAVYTKKVMFAQGDIHKISMPVPELYKDYKVKYMLWADTSKSMAPVCEFKLAQ